jgi:pyruvate/2-oxoglutarate dehydrogenase complex dihydrolipoamide acyltransferase (E2) component
MILSVVLPEIDPNMKSAVIDAVYPAEGAALIPGAKLFDIIVDLSLAVAHDCPPVSHYRMVVRDRAWLRKILVRAGDEIPVGAPLAILSTEPEEMLDGTDHRNARLSIAGILGRSDAWD